MVDLADPDTIQDPYPAYRWLRDEAPVHLWERDGHPRDGIWLVSRHADVRALVADDRLTKRAERVGLEPGVPPILMFLDPPEHTRLRRFAAATFTRRQVERLRDEVEREVAVIAKPLVGGATVEVVADLATPLPLHTIMRLLGVPLGEGAELHALARRIADGTDAANANGAGADVSAEEEFITRMAQHVARTARDPGDDLTSALLEERDGDARLTEQDVTMLCVQLLVNGHETTVNLIGTALWSLLSHRDQWERLVADPSLAPRAVEECLRFQAPTQRSSERYALEDIEVAGTTIAAGSQVSGLIGSANRDERVFDRPDELDITRDPNAHLSFGHGRHHCPGSALTRLEVTAVLAHLATHAPDIDVVGDPPRCRPNSFDRGLESLTLARG